MHNRNGSENGATGDRTGPDHGLVRMVNSGTEATMSAIRLARVLPVATKLLNLKVVTTVTLTPAGESRFWRTHVRPAKFAGFPADFAKHTLTCTYNDLASVAPRLSNTRKRLPVLSSSRWQQYELRSTAARVPARSARAVHEFGALLIIDEVMTGFRVALLAHRIITVWNRISPASVKSSRWNACRRIRWSS